MSNRISATTAALVLVSVLPTTPVGAAAFKCSDGYQFVEGNFISTPYCEDAYLAQVARSAGMRVSDNAIRNNPNLKSEVCRFVGHDNRVRNYCSDESSGGRSTR